MLVFTTVYLYCCFQSNLGNGYYLTLVKKDDGDTERAPNKAPGNGVAQPDDVQVRL